MKQFLLGICLMTIGPLYAVIPNNVELIANSDFSNPALFADSTSGFGGGYANASVRGKWYAGASEVATYKVDGFNNTIADGFFDAIMPVDAATSYNNFLGQVSTEQFTTGRYHFSVKAKGTAPFYIKISSVAVMGTELGSILRNPSGPEIQKQTTLDYTGYSIKVTPIADTWATYSADLDITLSTTNYVRVFIIFPKTGAISLDDISMMRTKDLPTTFYVSPALNTTAWNAMVGITPDQIMRTDALSIAGTNTYYLAAGSYTTASTIAITTGKIYGGFSGNETAIDLNARATSDLDQNGIAEPWELTNATSITSSVAINKYDAAGNGTRFLTITGAGGEVDGVTLTDYCFTYAGYIGPIVIGQVVTTPTSNAENIAGKLSRSIVRKIKSSAHGVIVISNTASVVDRCLIEDNFGATSYGAIYFNKFGGIVSNSVIRNNRAATKGGAMYGGNAAANDLKAVVTNCAIYNNTALQNGGAIAGGAAANFAGIEIVNSTIVNNVTTAPGVASVELNNNGLLVNSIVLNDPLDEISVDNISNYVERNVFGSVTGSALYPALFNISGKAIADINFVNPTTIQGYVGLTSTDYDAVHKANFKINNITSAAYVSLATIPATYQIAGSGTALTTNATVPTTDILGAVRTNNMTLGAYYYEPASGVENTLTDKVFAFGLKNAIEVSGNLGEPVSVYNVSGQLVKSVKLSVDKLSIPVKKGFYIVFMGLQRNKVVVN